MRKIINVEDLCLSLDNPRLTDSQTEEEEIEKMVKEQKNKLTVLAEDIIDHGLNPLDMIAVYPSEKHQGKYVVAEGNRRATVIKILNNPGIISKLDEGLYKKFSQLKLKYKPINTVEAWVFINEADPNLSHWIEIRHMGEQKGKGTSNWNAIQKERHDKKIRGESKLLDFWDELKTYDILTYDEIMSITKTNWERILRDVGMDFLGIYKLGNKLIVPKDNIIEFKKKMRCVYKKLNNQTVGIVYDQEKIEKFFEEISIDLYGKANINTQEDLFTNSYTNEEQINIDKVDNKIEEADVSFANNKGNTKEESKYNYNNFSNKQKDAFEKCMTVIPKSFDIRSSNVRINKIIKELKEICVDDCPNACGTLLRILFELSAKLYLEKISGQDETETEFTKAITRVANELRNSNNINNSEHSAISKDLDNLRKLFNGYMHNTEAYPSSEAIKSIFKAHKKFLCECLK